MVFFDISVSWPNTCWCWFLYWKIIHWAHGWWVNWAGCTLSCTVGKFYDLWQKFCVQHMHAIPKNAYGQNQPNGSYYTSYSSCMYIPKWLQNNTWVAHWPHDWLYRPLFMEDFPVPRFDPITKSSRGCFIVIRDEICTFIKIIDMAVGMKWSSHYRISHVTQHPNYIRFSGFWWIIGSGTMQQSPFTRCHTVWMVARISAFVTTMLWTDFRKSYSIHKFHLEFQ